MTIFSKVAQSFIVEALLAQIKRSEEKDAPPTKFFEYVEYVLPKRDKSLSQSKRAILHKLMLQLSQLHENELDLATTRMILAALRAYKAQIEDEARSKGRPAGSTELLIDQLIQFIKLLHKQAEKLRLTDQVDDKAAFAHFATAVTSYHAKRILNAIKANMVQNALENPSFTPIVKFQQELDQIVNHTYLSACKILGEPRESNAEEYNEKKNELGLLSIELLRLKHDEKHREYALTLSSTLSMLPNYLNDYLKVTDEPIIESTIQFMEEEEDDFTMYETDEVHHMEHLPIPTVKKESSQKGATSVDETTTTTQQDEKSLEIGMTKTRN